jgi:protein disulfide-isomerase-like protein
MVSFTAAASSSSSCSAGKRKSLPSLPQRPLTAVLLHQFSLFSSAAPWCGHCRALEPKYEKLGEQVLKDASLKETIIAKIDATANEYDRQKWEVSGYPTIFFKPAGKKAVKYEGAREVDDMKSFIKKNGKNIKKGAKKADKKKKNKSKKNKKQDD